MTAPPARDDRGRLLPGHTANPSGRPRVVEEIKELAREKVPAAFARICALIDSADERTALAAAQEVLNRAYGKPTQAVEKTVEKFDWGAMFVAAAKEMSERRSVPKTIEGTATQNNATDEW